MCEGVCKAKHSLKEISGDAFSISVKCFQSVKLICQTVICVPLA